MKKIQFVKAIASGNDFVIIERKEVKKISLDKLARLLCDRKYGIGADGLLISQPSERADLRMRIFNPDGSEAEMCGNGIRCFILWANYRNLIPQEVKIETLAGVIEGRLKKNELVKVKLSASFKCLPEMEIKFKNKPLKGTFINTGVPHFVIEVRNLEKTDVRCLGSFIRWHKLFKPSGTNVDFVEYRDGKLYLRTYERGVEDETLACGTGCVAAALSFGRKREIKMGKIKVVPRSREALEVSYRLEEGGFKDVFLEGRAKMLFEGKFNFKN